MEYTSDNVFYNPAEMRGRPRDMRAWTLRRDKYLSPFHRQIFSQCREIVYLLSNISFFSLGTVATSMHNHVKPLAAQELSSPSSLENLW